MNVYMISPYTHEDEDVMKRRAQVAINEAGRLMEMGYYIFSPIVHCHPLAVLYDLPRDYKFWKGYNETFLRCWANIAYVLCYNNWFDSEGVKDEIMIAQSMGMPVYYSNSSPLPKIQQ